MSDIFGIGTAIKACCEIYFIGARRTGRTTALIKGLQNGDCVVFNNDREAQYTLMEARKSDLDIRTIVVTDGRLREAFDRTRSVSGRVVLDHSFIQVYYTREIRNIESSLNHFYGTVNKNKDDLTIDDKLSRFDNLN